MTTSDAATPESVTHLIAVGGYRACDTWADWSGCDTTNVTCPECLAGVSPLEKT